MKILSAEQIKQVDEYTIDQLSIKSVDLMEKAAGACAQRLERLYDKNTVLHVFCGEGNNGGDGLAISRMLIEKGFVVTTLLVHSKGQMSADASTNLERLIKFSGHHLVEIKAGEDLKQIKTDDRTAAIDALLGTGANKPAQGVLGDAISFINQNYKEVISIDVPSGLFCDQSSGTSNRQEIVRSHLCLTFQLPKLAFLLPNNASFVPRFEILDIGLSEKKINESETSFYYLTRNDICSLLTERPKFSHKGSYGHGLLMAGSKGKNGAALIASHAALRSGCGLLTLHSNSAALSALLNQHPEAMGSEDESFEFISECPELTNYQALAFGPGTGTHHDTQQVLKKILNYYAGKLVIDADGLNILSENKTWLSFLPPSTILTPHPKEFERLTEKFTDDFDRLKQLKIFSIKNNCIVILKGAHSAIAMPDGNIFFNSTGNPGMAKGGSGDALTGIILGLLARGYNAPQAALIGAYVHGLAGDLCANEMSMESILASDIIEKLPLAFLSLERSKS
jgi:NAD(P)H-hydrate epimerase